MVRGVGDIVADSIDPNRVLTLVGATGTGKTSLVPLLAKLGVTDIICLDAMQLYKELVFGSAAPSISDRAVLPHHLFGEFSVEKPVTAAAYADIAKSLVIHIQKRGGRPALVGGTGMYLSFFNEQRTGLPATPTELRARVNRWLEIFGSQRCHRLLAKLDPVSADQLHPNDRQRIQRYLEVRLLTGRSIRAIWDEQDEVLQNPPTIGLHKEKQVLWQHLQIRLDDMLRAGWLEEIDSIMRRDLTGYVEKIGPIGYGQLFAYRRGEVSFDEARERIFIETRQYAKRQRTWFKRLNFIEWFTFDPGKGYNTSDLSAFVQKSLA